MEFPRALQWHMGAEMADKRTDDKQESSERPSTSANVPPKAVREVVVTHLDAPPPPGKRNIHPRRPAPIVPTREERTGEQLSDDPNTEKPPSE